MQVAAILTDTVRTPVGGRQTLEVTNWLALTLQVRVKSKIQDGHLQYVPAASDTWQAMLFANPQISGISGSDVAAQDVAPAGSCAAGGTHSVVVEAEYNRLPHGPASILAPLALSTSC